jgi:regulator of RNase E activity RraB
VQVFSWLLVGAAVVAVLRIYFTVRKLRAQQADDWDEKLVKNLRAQGGDPFSPYQVDFFFDLPDEAACEKVAALLRTRDYAIDFRRVEPDRGDRYTLHALKSVRVSVPDMQALTRELSALAVHHGGRYDGWATAGITRSAQR